MAEVVPFPGQPPPHVCAACGTVNDHVGAELRRLETVVAEQARDMENLEHELRAKRARIKDLQQGADKLTKDGPVAQEAMEILEHWKALCAPRARDLASGKRLANCVARLRGGYSKHDLMRAVWGYSLKPYVVGRGERASVGPRSQWFADAELIFRDPQKVDQGLRLADEEDERLALERARDVEPDEPLSEEDVLEDLGAELAARWGGRPPQQRPLEGL